MEKQSEARVDAVERLETAREEQAQRADQLDAASGSGEELPARARLHAAEDQSAAREAWVRWTERDY